MAVTLRNPTDTYGNCTTCGAFCVHKTHHQCPPVWRVRMEGDEDAYASPIHARDAELAAEEYCERHDSDLDYTIIRNGEATLIVERDGVEVRVSIEAESRPHYSAMIIEPAPLSPLEASVSVASQKGD